MRTMLVNLELPIEDFTSSHGEMFIKESDFCFARNRNVGEDMVCCLLIKKSTSLSFFGEIFMYPIEKTDGGFFIRIPATHSPYRTVLLSDLDIENYLTPIEVEYKIPNKEEIIKISKDYSLFDFYAIIQLAEDYVYDHPEEEAKDILPKLLHEIPRALSDESFLSLSDLEMQKKDLKSSSLDLRDSDEADSIFADFLQEIVTLIEKEIKQRQLSNIFALPEDVIDSIITEAIAKEDYELANSIKERRNQGEKHD